MSAKILLKDILFNRAKVEQVAEEILYGIMRTLQKPNKIKCLIV